MILLILSFAVVAAFLSVRHLSYWFLDMLAVTIIAFSVGIYLLNVENVLMAAIGCGLGTFLLLMAGRRKGAVLMILAMGSALIITPSMDILLGWAAGLLSPFILILLAVHQIAVAMMEMILPKLCLTPENATLTAIAIDALPTASVVMAGVGLWSRFKSSMGMAVLTISGKGPVR